MGQMRSFGDLQACVPPRLAPSWAHSSLGCRGLLWLLLSGCSSQIVTEPSTGGGGADGGGGAGAGAAGGSGGTEVVGGAGGGGNGGGGGEGGNGGAPTFDCAVAPTAPLGMQVLPGLRGYHGLAIDQAGWMYGLDVASNLIRSTHEGNWTPVLGNVFAEQIAFAANGHLMMNTFEGLGGITPEAQRYTINANVFGYGLRVGPNEQLYVADGSSIQRVDPATGVNQIVVSSDEVEWVTHAFDFSPALDRLYVGMIGPGGGQVRVVTLDENFNATSPLKPFADVAPDYAWLDGVAVDICGNLYVPNFNTSQLFKITQDGVPSLYVDWSSNSTQYGHGVIFGNGIGGFREDALYLPMPYNNHTVMEIIVGIPSRTFAGEVLNGPTSGRP